MALPPRYAQLIGTKWTSSAPLLGWRQVSVVGARRGIQGWEVELAAPVEPARQSWVFAAALANPARFSPGWATPVEVRVEPALPPTPALTAVTSTAKPASR